MTRKSGVPQAIGAVPLGGAVPGEGAPGTTQSRLVLGFDHDAASQTALATAVDLAGRLQAWLTVVHVIDLPDYPANLDAPDWAEYARATLADERHLAEQALRDHPHGWSYEAWYGPRAATLIRVAEAQDALMVIVGRHGHGVGDGLHRLLDGSVSRHLAARCPRPVLVVSLS